MFVQWIAYNSKSLPFIIHLPCGRIKPNWIIESIRALWPNCCSEEQLQIKINIHGVRLSPKPLSGNVRIDIFVQTKNDDICVLGENRPGELHTFSIFVSKYLCLSIELSRRRNELVNERRTIQKILAANTSVELPRAHTWNDVGITHNNNVAVCLHLFGFAMQFVHSTRANSNKYTHAFCPSFNPLANNVHVQQFQYTICIWHFDLLMPFADRSLINSFRLVVRPGESTRFNCHKWFVCLHFREWNYVDATPSATSATAVPLPFIAKWARGTNATMQVAIALILWVRSVHSRCTLVVCWHNWLKYKSKQRHKSFSIRIRKQTQRHFGIGRVSAFVLHILHVHSSNSPILLFSSLLSARIIYIIITIPFVEHRKQSLVSSVVSVTQ